MKRLLAVPLSILMLTALIAPAQAAVKPTPRTLTAAQSQLLRTTLASRGVAAANIDQAMANPAIIPVGETSATTSGTAARAAGGGGVTPLNLGSSCSGTSRWLSRTQYINSVFGEHLAWYTMKTTWCSTSTRVTFATSTRTGGVYSLGVSGNITYSGEGSYNEYFYNYVGTLPNSGAYSITQGIFTQSLWYVTQGYTLTIQNWVHYNGTYGTTSSCSGC